MEYLFRKVDKVFVVWLAKPNRFILFREPAYKIFRLWSKNTPEEQIITDIGKKYRLPPEEAKRFTVEVTDLIGKTLEESLPEEQVTRKIINSSLLLQKGSEKNYAISETVFRIHYGNAYIESGIHPKFQHLQNKSLKADAKHTFHLTYSDGFFGLSTGFPGEPAETYTRFESLVGALYLRILNIVHHSEADSWMGVFHASAVAMDNRALLFVAPSGSGKTTLAALLVANGCKLLSDDFVPISIAEPEVHQFPAAISVKGNAIPALKAHFSVLENMEDNPGTKQGKEIFLPFPDNSFHLKKTHTKAIVFVRFDPMTGYHLKKESNLEMMNELLEQSWIPRNARAAGRFLEWYFNLPVYTLRYSDNHEAVEKMKELLSS